MAKYQSTKLFDNYSVAIRQWKAAHSHCELLHGYALKFKVWFESIEPLEENQLDEMNYMDDLKIWDARISTPSYQPPILTRPTLYILTQSRCNPGHIPSEL